MNWLGDMLRTLTWVGCQFGLHTFDRGSHRISKNPAVRCRHCERAWEWHGVWTRCYTSDIVRD